MILSCVVIDDEPLALDLMESYVMKTPFLKLSGKFSGAVEALKALPHKPADLIFADIQMPELNGLEFSRMVPESTKVIFTTAFERYAIEGYKVSALDYLLKPISYADFLQAADRALQCFGKEEVLRQRKSMETIFVKADYKWRQIELKKILYVEGLKDYVKIVLEDEVQPVLSLMSMKAMEELLPSGRFSRVHRSFIVQLEKIRIVERNRIVFGKQYIPVSDSCKDEFMAYLNSRSIPNKG